MSTNINEEVLERAREIAENELFPDEHPGDAHANYVYMAKALLSAAVSVEELERRLAIAVEALEKSDCDCCDGRDHDGIVRPRNISTCSRCLALNKIDGMGEK